MVRKVIGLLCLVLTPGLASAAEPVAATDACEDLCPGPTPHLLETLDTRPIDELPPSRGKGLRGFASGWPLPPLLAIEFVERQDGTGTVTVRTLGSREPFPHLSVRSAPVARGRISQLWAGVESARAAIARRKNEESHAREVVVCTGDAPSSYIEYRNASEHDAVRIDNDCPSNEVFVEVEHMADVALPALADCNTIHLKKPIKNLDRLYFCMSLEGDRSEAGKVLSLSYDVLGEQEIDRPHIQALFAPDASFTSGDHRLAVGPEQCTEQWMRVVRDEAAQKGTLQLAFDSFTPRSRSFGSLAESSWAARMQNGPENSLRHCKLYGAATRMVPGKSFHGSSARS